MIFQQPLNIIDKTLICVVDTADGATVSTLKDILLTLYHTLQKDYAKLHDLHAPDHKSILPSYILPTRNNKDFVVKCASKLESLGLVRFQYDKYTSSQKGLQWSTIVVTDKGSKVAKRIREGRRPIIDSSHGDKNEIFIACALGYEEIDNLFEKELSPACEMLGFRPVRVDREEPEQTITNAILKGITRAECVIADLTHARQSVYFEAGFAYGQGIPILLTCREDHYRGEEDVQKVHFDLEQYKISFWNKSNSEFNWQDKMSPRDRLPSVLGIEQNK